MSTKRPFPHEQASNSQQPSTKKVHFEPCRIGAVSTLEDLDIKVLQFQNKKLYDRLEQRHKNERELKLRIEQLEKRQTSDEAVLNVVNRYWNQLNEDVRIMLQRFDGETSDESETRNENEATTSFLNLLSHWDRDELDEKLAQRVQVSTRATGKLLQVFDRMVQRNHKMMQAIGKNDKGEGEAASLDEAVCETNREIQLENQKMHALVTSLHETQHKTSLKFSELQERVSSADTTIAELKNRIEDLEYELSKKITREEKLENNLADCVQKLKKFNVTDLPQEGKPVVIPFSQSKLDELQQQLEEQKELSNSRLSELETLNSLHKDALKLAEKLKMDIQCLPESIVVETAEYKCLQSQFSVLYNESMQLKTQLDDMRTILQTTKNTHMRQLEQMEAEELTMQKKLRNEVVTLEDALSQVRREYEMLRIEFEQNMAATEQTGPINREMRHLITSLQNHNQQLKGEVQRFKRKLKESLSETQKLKLAAQTAINESVVPETPPIKEESPTPIKEEPNFIKEEDTPLLTSIKEEPDDFKEKLEKIKTDPDIIRDLKAQLKKAQEGQKELKILLDMYKSASKEHREKVQLMAAEKKARAEIEELKLHLRKNQDIEKKEKRKLADDEALKKIKSLEDTVQQLQKTLSMQKQEEEALLNEMEVTGQAFEDMQEQNLRLMQQLREKDDANFKLMSERIKSNQIQKLLREEKDILANQVGTLSGQVEAQNQVVRKLEEKERLLITNLTTMEKESNLRLQTMEIHKRKAIESAQSAADLKLHLDKYLSQLKEAQNTVSDKTCALQQEAFKTKRLQEEIIISKKALERAKKFELANTADEVLMEEIKEYKEQLTCPSCKVKRKDAVLSKCFHVFCFDCLKTRYETRQRKCPKCNAGFGANDYHRLYLA